jgi:IS5 family transposase
MVLMLSVACVRVTTKTKLVKSYELTPAHRHDSQLMAEFIEEEDSGQPLYEDSTYRSETIESHYTRMVVDSRIPEKGFRNKPLTKRQIKANRKRSKVRARIEYIFALMENSMNGMYRKYRRLGRVSTGIGLMNVT